MSQLALPLEGGLLRRPQSPAAPPPEFDAARAQRERRRRETQLRQLDQRIRSQRARDRREGTTTDFTDDLLRRDQIGDDLLRISTALRPERQQTTAGQVLERREDLQRQGVAQAQADLDRASAPPSPEVIESIRRATEARSVQAAIAARAPGANVPANDLLPSNLNRAAASDLLRRQGAAIGDATRRLDAFEGFGLTPEQAAAQATEANAAAARRNTERADARTDLARLFADEDAEEARLEQTRRAVQEATEQRQIAALLAERRALDSVGVPPPPSPREALELDLLQEQVTEAGLSNEAERRLLRQSQSARARSAIEQLVDEQAGPVGQVQPAFESNAISALERATQGGFTEREAQTVLQDLDRAMARVESLRGESQKLAADNILAQLSAARTRSPEGSVGDFLRLLPGAASLFNPFDEDPIGNMDLRIDANQRMRKAAQDAFARLQAISDQ